MLVRVPSESAYPRRDRRDPPLASRPRDYHWVLEADIAACFDEIGHTPLLDRVRARIKDKRVVCAGEGVPESRDPYGTRGSGRDVHRDPARRAAIPVDGQHCLVCAGRALRPAMAGTDGDQLSAVKRVKAGLGNWRLIRYADDFVVMVRGERRHAEALREEVAAVLAPLGLRLSLGKTRVVHVDEGFTFLGFDIRRQRKKGRRSITSTPNRLRKRFKRSRIR